MPLPVACAEVMELELDVPPFERHASLPSTTTKLSSRRPPPAPLTPVSVSSTIRSVPAATAATQWKTVSVRLLLENTGTLWAERTLSPEMSSPHWETQRGSD